MKPELTPVNCTWLKTLNASTLICQRAGFASQRNPLAEGHIPVDVTRPVHHVHARVADGSDGRFGKRGGIEIDYCRAEAPECLAGRSRRDC